jgi:8-amino-7-oxononanoate synthase
MQRYYDNLVRLAKQGQTRQLGSYNLTNNPMVVHLASGQLVIQFSGNDYLGLSQHPLLIEAAKTALDQWGAGAGGSPLINGFSQATQALHQAIATWKQTESALVFNSGYQGHMAVLQGVLRAGDVVFSDRLNHASLVDGVLLAKAHLGGSLTTVRYAHTDTADLAHKMAVQHAKRQAGSQFWIVTDTVFSMDGDVADLPALAQLAKTYDALLMVDEAHASGLYGNARSSGLAEAQGVDEAVTLHLGTFSKALGSSGAYVAGPAVLINTLINHARGYIYSTALPPSVIATNTQAIHVVSTQPQFKHALWQAVQHVAPAFTQLAQRHQLPLPKQDYGTSPIFPFILGSTERTMDLSQRLLKEGGIWAHAIRPPSVPMGAARLRISLSARHTPQQLETLLLATNHHMAIMGMD